MALRLSSNRSLFSLSWVYLVLIFLAGMFITGMLARSEITADRSRDDALNTSIAASVAMQIGTSVGEFYTPTVAGEGFVSSAVAESQDLEVPEAQILDTSFEPFVGPLVSYLGPALLDYQLAPAGVVTYSSRPEQNAAALGHNLFLDDERRDTILLTVEQRQPIVSGPVDLIQGGPESSSGRPFSSPALARSGIATKSGQVMTSRTPGWTQCPMTSGGLQRP